MKRRKQIKSHVRSASYLCSHIKLNRPKMNRALSLGKIGALGLAVLLGTSCNKESVCDEETIPQEEENGKQMLLIGNSFFRPYAEHLDIVAADAGYTEHSSTIVTRGGTNGWASSFWNDSTTQESLTIRAALDAGGVELFAMTSGGIQPIPLQATKLGSIMRCRTIRISWSGYLLPPVDFPASWDSTAQSYGYNGIDDFYPAVVDYCTRPSSTVCGMNFLKPTFFPSQRVGPPIHLAQMQQDDLLEDNIDLFGAKPTSIFTDDKGHQGQIVIETGTLIWLASIYGDNLNSNDYVTGFETDLHGLATQIMNDHDESYKQ